MWSCPTVTGSIWRRWFWRSGPISASSTCPPIRPRCWYGMGSNRWKWPSSPSPTAGTRHWPRCVRPWNAGAQKLRSRTQNAEADRGSTVSNSLPDGSIQPAKLSRLPRNYRHPILGAALLDADLEADPNFLGNPFTAQHLDEALGLQVPDHG